jgi:DNA polymerase V
MFALVDCNNFYASCERVFQPNLVGKPIVVLSNNDGCVISRSNEAKKLQVPMGAPAFKYEAFFKRNKIHVFSSNYALYGDMSCRVMDSLAKFTPDIEVYSIDEAFLKLTGFENHNLEAYGEQIRKTITKGTGIPVSVGIAPTKALAKLANKIAKKSGKTCVIDTDEKRIKALQWCSINDVWGIGRRLSKNLLAKNIKTAYDFSLLDDLYVKRMYSIVEYHLKKELEGISKLDLALIKNKKTIATTRTFENMLTDFDALNERLTTFVVSSAEKMRKQKSACYLLSVFIETNRYRNDLSQYRQSIVLKLPQPTNSSLELVREVKKGLKSIYIEGYSYKRGGIALMGIVDDDTKQLDLFFKENKKHLDLMKVIDMTNDKFGKHKIRLGGQGLGKTWKMKQERLSPNYTTKLRDILIVKV